MMQAAARPGRGYLPIRRRGAVRRAAGPAAVLPLHRLGSTRARAKTMVCPGGGTDARAPVLPEPDHRQRIPVGRFGGPGQADNRGPCGWVYRDRLLNRCWPWHRVSIILRSKSPGVPDHSGERSIRQSPDVISANVIHFPLYSICRPITSDALSRGCWRPRTPNPARNHLGSADSLALAVSWSTSRLLKNPFSRPGPAHRVHGSVCSRWSHAPVIRDGAYSGQAQPGPASPGT